jgi:hypothetical protein
MHGVVPGDSMWTTHARLDRWKKWQYGIMTACA